MEKDDKKRKTFLSDLESMFGDRYAEILRYISHDIRVFLRDDQLAPHYDDTSWVGAIWCTGRGYGKSYCGAAAVIEFAIQTPNARIGLLGPTFSMAKQNMIQGSSGILGLSPIGFKPKYNKSDGTLTWPNGATAKVFSAENGDRVRGENFHLVWSDEWAFFKHSSGDDDIWDNAKKALRAGSHPRYIITTSPRPIKGLKDLYEQSKKDGSNTIFTTGTTFDNYSLPQSFIDEVKLGEGTSLYNQEVLGMILEENLGAIFSYETIKRIDLDVAGEDVEKYDERYQKLVNSMDSIVVAVDPNVVEDISSDETGITVTGRKGDKAYVFKDASRRGKISHIYADIVRLYHEYGAEAVVVETNNGGDFIPTAIHNIDPMVVVKKVFASKGKRARAEPIGLLYERGKIYHVGIHRELEAQMCEYNPQVHKKSPDRMDSLVWSITYLYPSTMRGLFDSDSVTDSLDKNKKTKITDLYADLYNQVNDEFNPYSLSQEEPDEGDVYF